MSVIAAPVCGIRAGRALRALGHTSCKRQASGSNPLTGSQFSGGKRLVSAPFRGTNVPGRGNPAAMPRVAKGHIE